VSYEQMLLQRSSPRTKQAITRLNREMWPIFKAHLLWRPHARSWASAAMNSRDMETLKNYVGQLQKLARKVGLELEMPPGY